MSEKILHAVYDDDDKLIEAVKEIRTSKYSIEEILHKINNEIITDAKTIVAIYFAIQKGKISV